MLWSRDPTLSGNLIHPHHLPVFQLFTHSKCLVITKCLLYAMYHARSWQCSQWTERPSLLSHVVERDNKSTWKWTNKSSSGTGWEALERQWLEQGSLTQRYGPGTVIHKDLVAYLLYRNQSMGWNDTMSGICFRIIWEGEVSEVQVKHNWLELVRVEAGWWSSYSTYFMHRTFSN